MASMGQQYGKKLRKMDEMIVDDAMRSQARQCSDHEIVVSSSRTMPGARSTTFSVAERDG